MIAVLPFSVELSSIFTSSLEVPECSVIFMKEGNFSYYICSTKEKFFIWSVKKPVFVLGRKMFSSKKFDFNLDILKQVSEILR